MLRMLADLKQGSLSIQFPDGNTHSISGCEPGPDATLILHNWKLIPAAIRRGTIGVAETYIDGDWDSPDVPTFLELFVVNADMRSHMAGIARLLSVVVENLRHFLRSNTKSQAKKNIASHYDLGNSFYEQWLDPGMTYSSALYQTGANDLESAQKAKYAALADAIGAKRGDHVLEIGCGWGAFAEYLAKDRGVKVTGLTISQSQLDYARDRIEKAGLTDLVELRFQDYREEKGQYDHIVSVEMFEAVGEKYWNVYFEKLRECLKPGGSAGVQVITIHEKEYAQYRRSPDFIQKYVFPGGMLPTREIMANLGKEAGLALSSERAFAHDYARTLAEWYQRFTAAWPTIEPLGYDGRFKRLWEFYLNYCEAGFRAENINVRQLVYEKA
ncbi:cyclopropane-fatty-acyl-phospholipid synthase family protein [Hoeflea sp. CAU 1731]